MSLPLSSDAQRLIHEALYQGNKIAAIKYYREAANVGLAEAKRAVEQMEAELRVQTPTQFAQPAIPLGLSATLILVAIGMIPLAITVIVTGGGQGVEGHRYTLALGIVLSMFIVLQGSIASFNPKRHTMAYILLGLGVVLMALTVARVLHA